MNANGVRGRGLTSGRVLSLVLLVALPSIVRAQAWSEAIRPPNFPSVRVQWRLYGTDTRTRRNVFEWVFSNTADTAVSFNYRIETNRQERRIGRISFKPRRRQLSGWIFAGDSLVHIELAPGLLPEPPVVSPAEPLHVKD